MTFDLEEYTEMYRQFWRNYTEQRHVWTNVDEVFVGRGPAHWSGSAAPRIAEAVLERVNQQFFVAVESTNKKFAVVLSQEDANTEAGDLYVYYEPAADFVVALQSEEDAGKPDARRIELCATGSRWTVFRPEFMSSVERVEQLVRGGEIENALVACFEELVRLSSLLDTRPDLLR